MKSYIPLILISQTSAHMYMSNPPPRNFKENQFVKNIDYDISAPITLSQFPCKNYAPLESTRTVQAGSNLQVTLAGEAPHNGGNCEFSVSYDQQNWVVLKTVLGDCMMPQMNYDVPIPQTAPNGKVSFSWSWVNRSGNREFYQDCADITITGGQDGGSFTGPKMVVANFPGFPEVPENDNMSVIPGKELYDNRPNISISPSGSVGSAPAPAPAPASQSAPAPPTLAIAEPQGQQNVVAEQAADSIPPIPQFPSIPNQITKAPIAIPDPTTAPQPVVVPTTIAPATTPSAAPQVQPTQPAIIPQDIPTQPQVEPQVQPTKVPSPAHKKKCKKH